MTRFVVTITHRCIIQADDLPPLLDALDLNPEDLPSKKALLLDIIEEALSELLDESPYDFATNWDSHPDSTTTTSIKREP